MAMTKKHKNAAKAIYLDLICGIISSVLALSGIAVAVIFNRVFDIGWFTISVTFWSGYLIFSFVLVGVGIHSWYKEKNFDKYETRKDLRAPVV